MRYLPRFPAALACLVLLVGCAEREDFSDIDRYMSDVKKKPSGHIETLPEFTQHEVFLYQASGLRSPFEAPLLARQASQQINSDVKPDLKRIKGPLEQFDIETFSMVGSISGRMGLWGLVRGTEGVHRIKVGDFLGRNHGRVTAVGRDEIKLTEIVPAGTGVWIERPRTLRMETE